MIVWDELKRAINLAKHGFDFEDAWRVYENPLRLTFELPRHEKRIYEKAVKTQPH